ncbi:DUF4291 family protein [Massilia violaceinigra]|uniref:DUF4291 family protein n=1 Tax=Massilia violaceinigra TaxID=2045208 RepID=UPI0022773B47|nr:DUF4291 family protein [Massilia violaceinigra]
MRATYDDATIRVYQAYSDSIADGALSAGTFVSPLAHEIHALVQAGQVDDARARLPVERVVRRALGSASARNQT